VYEFQSEVRLFAPAGDGTYVPGPAIPSAPARAAVMLADYLCTADT